MNKNTQTLSVLMLSLLGVGLTSTVWVKTNMRYLSISLSLQDGPILLEISGLRQVQDNSCGEAAIVMAYNHVHPEFPLQEDDVITYAIKKGHFTPDEEPFTSPRDMVLITRHYTYHYSTGNVSTADQALELLIGKLQNGTPVIIDVLNRSEASPLNAQYVVVTGISADPNGADAVTIYYNDLLTGSSNSAPWSGEAGIWNAWQNNPDPDGAGWWLVLSA